MDESLEQLIESLPTKLVVNNTSYYLEIYYMYDMWAVRYGSMKNTQDYLYYTKDTRVRGAVEKMIKILL